MLDYDRLLANKTILITGGSQGIGKAMTQLFATHGATLFIGDIAMDQAKAVAKEIVGQGGKCTALSLNVTSAQDWTDVVGKVVAETGTIDVLVNNAGTNIRKPLLEMSLTEWEHVINVNVNGVFLGMSAVIPRMIANRTGNIVNMSSVAGLLGHLKAAAYSASKGAVRSLTKAAAVQYGTHGIRINSIHPGMIYSPMTAATLDNKEQLEQLEKTIPLGRVGLTDDVAQAALFLASDASSYMTGSEVVIDGGQSCYFTFNGSLPW